MSVNGIGFVIDSLEVFDFIFEHRLFDRIWLLNQYRVGFSSFARQAEIELIKEEGKRNYLLKGFAEIPIRSTFMIEVGDDGLLPGPKDSEVPRRGYFPGKEWKLANSILKREKVDAVIASKLIGFLLSKYFVTNNPQFSKVMETYKEDIQRIRAPMESAYFHPKILKPAGFENLVNDLLQDDEYCKYHSAETVRPFSLIT